MKPKPTTGLWTVCTPNGHLIHTHLSTNPDEAIEDFMSTESVGQWIYNVGRGMRGESKAFLPSWEGFEAEGYSVVQVEVVPVNQPVTP